MAAFDQISRALWLITVRQKWCNFTCRSGYTFGISLLLELDVRCTDTLLMWYWYGTDMVLIYEGTTLFWCSKLGFVFWPRTSIAAFDQISRSIWLIHIFEFVFDFKIKTIKSALPRSRLQIFRSWRLWHLRPCSQENQSTPRRQQVRMAVAEAVLDLGHHRVPRQDHGLHHL